MPIRLFRCIHCGHKMRLTGDSCGSCNEYKKMKQRLYFYLVPAVVLLLWAPSMVPA